MKAFKAFNRWIITISGVLGIGNLDSDGSVIPSLIAIAVAFASAFVLWKVKQYEEWKKAEKKRVEKDICRRLNRIYSDNRMSGLPR